MGNENNNKMQVLNLDYTKKFQNPKLTSEQQKQLGTWAGNLGKYGVLNPSGNKTQPGFGVKIKDISTTGVDTNKKNAPAIQNAKTCSNFCRKTGFNILPLRYSVILGKKAPVLPNNLGKNVKDIQLNNSSYIVEMVNSGYIYCLVKRKKGTLEWLAYKVTTKGHLSYFNPLVGKPPINVPEFSCNQGGHNFASSLITIENNPDNLASSAYVLYTPVPMSQNRIRHYRQNADLYAENSYWQKINISAAPQMHSLSFGQLKSVVHNIKSYGDSRLNLMIEKFKKIPNAYTSIALYDAIGITSKLNNFRNQLSFSNIKNFLDIKDKYNITNDHKVQTMLTIDGLEETLKRNFVAAQVKAVTVNDQAQDFALEELERKLKEAKNNKNYVLEKYYQDAIAKKKKADAEYKEKMGKFYEKRGSELGSKAWTDKYKPLLNMPAYTNFKSEYSKEAKDSETIALQHADDHLAWIKSDSLKKGLNVFDTDVYVPFGFYYHVIVMDFLKGMSGNSKSNEVLKKWMSQEKITSDNYYMKAYLYNNKNIEKEYDNAMNGIKLTNWEDESSVGKGFIGAMTGADAAWEQWRNTANINSLFPNFANSITGKAFHWLAEAMNYLISKTPKIYYDRAKPIGEFGRWIFLLRARTGQLANLLGSGAMFYRVDYQLWKALKSPNLNTRTYAAVRAHQRIKDTLEDMTKSGNANGNRIAMIVTFLEFINLLMQRDKALEDGKKDFEFTSQFGAATFCLLGASLDMAGSWFSTSRLASAAGGLKAAGAIFATVGGALGAYLDYQALKKEDDKIIKTILLIKIITGVAAVLAGTLLAVGLTAQVIAKQVTWITLKNVAEKLVLGRVAYYALLAVGRLNLFGLGLSVVEIFLRKFFVDDALEDWCKQCSFRLATVNVKKPFKDAVEEEKAFAQAIMMV